VTGASRGIGRAIALRLASRGSTVVATARDEARLAELVSEIAGGGRACERAAHRRGQPPPPVEQGFERLLSEHGRLDQLVNNGVTRDHACSCH